MNSFTLGIFLMVIVIGTLGSGNKASKEDTKPLPEPKRLNEPKKDDSSFVKRAIDPGTVIAAAQFSIEVLTKILELLGNIERKIAIGVENNSGLYWEALNTYFYSGTSDVTLPKDVASDKALLYDVRKTEGPVARGCVGVLAYYIPALKKTLSVLFSDPYDRNFYSNWWDVSLTDGKTNADEEKYHDMYNSGPIPGDDGWHEKDIGSGLKVKGSMASSGTPTLEIHVTQAD